MNHLTRDYTSPIASTQLPTGNIPHLFPLCSPWHISLLSLLSSSQNIFPVGSPRQISPLGAFSSSSPFSKSPSSNNSLPPFPSVNSSTWLYRSSSHHIFSFSSPHLISALRSRLVFLPNRLLAVNLFSK